MDCSPKIMELHKAGDDYFYGRGRRKNYKKAFRCLIEVARVGSPRAQALVGICYERGLGIQKDMRSAIKWFRRAAQQGNTYAKCNLAFFYIRGQALKENPRKAAELWQSAASDGDACALGNLALLYLEGRGGVPRDPKKAVEMLRRAAQGGEDEAWCTLGWLYEWGDCVKESMYNARRCYQKAAAMGNRSAVRELKRSVLYTPSPPRRAPGGMKDENEFFGMTPGSHVRAPRPQDQGAGGYGIETDDF